MSQISNPAVWGLLLAIPVLLFYNFNERWFHKSAMHRPIKGLNGTLMPAFHRHTHQHHVYFTTRQMSYDTNREWRIELFPRYALPVFMLLTLPVAVFAGYVWSANAGYLLMMPTPIYYLNYEIFHLCCHVNDNWFVRYRPLPNSIRRHHATQHNQPIVMERNMNLTYPVADWYMGTGDLDRGLLGHLFDCYNTRFVKDKYVQNQGTDMDADVKPA